MRNALARFEDRLDRVGGLVRTEHGVRVVAADVSMKPARDWTLSAQTAARIPAQDIIRQPATA